MRPVAALIVVAASLMPAQALAQTAQPASPLASEHRLSAEEVEAVLADAAHKREAAEKGLGPMAIEGDPPRQVHGEVGVAIGTGGYREVFGTAIYPMGDDGAAAISLDFIDLGKRRYKR